MIAIVSAIQPCFTCAAIVPPAPPGRCLTGVHVAACRTPRGSSRPGTSRSSASDAAARAQRTLSARADPRSSGGASARASRPRPTTAHPAARRRPDSARAPGQPLTEAWAVQGQAAAEEEDEEDAMLSEIAREGGGGGRVGALDAEDSAASARGYVMEAVAAMREQVLASCPSATAPAQHCRCQHLQGGVPHRPLHWQDGPTCGCDVRQRLARHLRSG